MTFSGISSIAKPALLFGGSFAFASILAVLLAWTLRPLIRRLKRSETRTKAPIRVGDAWASIAAGWLMVIIGLTVLN